MAVQAGQAASYSRTTTVATALVAPGQQRITITPDPYATPRQQAANAGVAVPVPSSYVYAPGLISGLYE
jgi:hypothetical protein